MALTFKITSGDWNSNPATGRPTTISGKDKLAQDIKEFFTIQVLPNGFGAGIEQLVGVVEDSPDMFISLTSKQIREGLATFVSLIRADPRINRVAAERIVGLSNILVSKDINDPTKYYFNVNIITENGLSTQFSQSIAV